MPIIRLYHFINVFFPYILNCCENISLEKVEFYFIVGKNRISSLGPLVIATNLAGYGGIGSNKWVTTSSRPLILTKNKTKKREPLQLLDCFFNNMVRSLVSLQRILQIETHYLLLPFGRNYGQYWLQSY